MGSHLASLIADYQAGRINRDDYWLALRDIHLTLVDYTVLLKNSDLDHIEIHADELRVRLKNGLQMVWEPEEIRTAPTMLVNYGTYETDEHNAIRKIVQHCDVVFDIGANIGWYSVHIAYWQPDIRIYAFEPIPTTFKQLERNIVLNSLESQIQPFSVALGESDDEIEFHIPRFMGSVAASRQPLFANDENIVVKSRMSRLDDWFANQAIEKIDFVKCDIEGAEIFFLRGAKETIREQHPIVMLEMLRKWAKVYDYHPNDIITLMDELGYICYFYEDDRFEAIASIDDECLHTNFFFFHPEHHDKILTKMNS